MLLLRVMVYFLTGFGGGPVVAFWQLSRKTGPSATPTIANTEVLRNSFLFIAFCFKTSSANKQLSGIFWKVNYKVFPFHESFHNS